MIAPRSALDWTRTVAHSLRVEWRLAKGRFSR